MNYRLQYVSPFDEGQQDQLRSLRRRSDARHPERPPDWQFHCTTLGLWELWNAWQLVGYVEYSIGPALTWQYGLRVAQEHRGEGLGWRLHAEWLRRTRALGTRIAIACAHPQNATMRTMLEQSRFEEAGMVNALPEPEVLYVGGPATFEWALHHQMAEVS